MELVWNLGCKCGWNGTGWNEQLQLRVNCEEFQYLSFKDLGKQGLCVLRTNNDLVGITVED